MKANFSSVAPIFYEVFSTEQEKEVSIVIYFGNNTGIEEAKGEIRGLINNGINGEYLIFDSGEEVRIDRIITINGIPGPAYDECDADAFASLNSYVTSDGFG